MTNRRLLLALLVLPLGLLAAAPTSCWFAGLDEYRGWMGVQLAATGRFRVEQVDGVWWFLTPAGHPFFSAGVTSVRSFGDYTPPLGGYPYLDNVLAKYGSAAAWAEVALARIAGAGLNTIGAWSENQYFEGRFPYTQFLEFSLAAPVIPGTTTSFGSLHDFFADSFESGAAATAEAARPCAADPYCIGIFSDNELPWGPAFNQGIPFVDAFMKLPAGAPGKLALQALLAERYGGDLTAFNTAWRLSLASFDAIQTLDALSTNFRRDSAQAQADRVAFRARVADRYFHVVHDALRAIDPAMLILGARFLAYSTAPDTVAAAAPWVDVLSINPYEWNDSWFAAAQSSAVVNGLYPVPELLADVDAMYATAGKPMLISEFGYRADDVGLPNSTPPTYPKLPDQGARADAYEQYMERVLARPHIIGAHWFKHADQPATGRTDGEDNNWGFVNIRDEVYPELFLRMAGVHQRMYTERMSLATP